ncbi:hypothetical protein INR49_021802 [Caranx melampygus]|nr:hypothetical protein INR49_021802 [Caranx melampygus]
MSISVTSTRVCTSLICAEPVPQVCFFFLQGGLSVRKKDRQRQIHSLIAQRFGLNGCHDEPPPTYEETLRHSLDVSSVSLRSLDVHLSTHSQDESSHLSEDTHSFSQPTTALQGPASSYCPAQNSRFLSL